jgi:NTE family protein
MKMEQVNKDFVVREIPLFAALSEEDRKLIQERSFLVEYKKEQLIYEEGAATDAFYCIVLGRAQVSTRDKDGNVTILEYLHRGKYFGIISLLTNEPHSVTAKVINDSTLLVIKKADFDFILQRVPNLAIDLSQTLSRRLKKKDIHQKTIFESTIISVFSSYSHAGRTVYALNLALSLHKETRKSVIILEICPSDVTHSLPHKFKADNHFKTMGLSGAFVEDSGIMKDFVIRNAFGVDLACISYTSEDEASIKKLLGILSYLLNDYHYIVLDLPARMDQFVFNILNQSDLIHILTSPEAVDLKKTGSLIHRLTTDFHFQPSRINVILNEYKSSKITHKAQCDLLDASIYATLHKIELQASGMLVLDEPESEYSKVIRRISRQIGENLVGLALGVGVGYGFCHIGVLKVIEEERIPIDIISGSSVGALIASLWATGRSSREILEITTKEFKHPKYTWGLIDLTFPTMGFIKGNKLYKFLKKILGEKTFSDVRLPLKIVASDIRKKETIILDKGLLIDAVMASCTMPGIFNPFKFKEGILFDGGVTSPLPTESLFKMGVKKIIAVNVTPSREDVIRQYERVKAGISETKNTRAPRNPFNIKHYLREKFKTNIIEIIFSSVELMQSEMIQKEAQLADVMLHPDTSGLHWLELYRAGEFARRGEEEARAHLEQMRQLVNE